jgi:hypothetical protein
MLNGLRVRREGGEGAAGEASARYCRASAPGLELEDERGSERFAFPGAEVFLFRAGEERFRLRLKDVSCTGLAGLTDAPLSPGELVVVQFEETFMPAAQVTWVSNARAGLRMVNALPLARMRHLAQRHEAGAAWSPAMRAGSDMHSWWTDLDAQKMGRRPQLDAGGHQHPLTR